MAKNKKHLIIPAILASVLVPIASVSASSVRVVVEVKPVAEATVTSETRDNITTYSVSVLTNSYKGYDVLVSSDGGENYELFKSVDSSKKGAQIHTATSDNDNLKFKAVPHE